MSITEVTTHTGGEPGSSANVNTEGADTQAATTGEKLFTQDQVDSIVKSRLAEQSQKLTSKLEKTWADKLAAALSERDQQVEKTVEDRVAVKLTEHALKAKRDELRAEYGLTDAQLSRLAGNTPDDLAADAETLFGALKAPRKPPVLHAGDAPANDSPLDLSGMTPAEIRERGAEIFAKMRQR